MAQHLLRSGDMANENKTPRDEDALEGEGSYTASKSYQDAAHQFAAEEDPEAHGKQALEDYDRNEPAYRKAEEEGKRRAAEEDPLLNE